MIPLCLERALVLAAEEWEGWGPEPHLLLAIICHVLDEGSAEILDPSQFWCSLLLVMAGESRATDD